MAVQLQLRSGTTTQHNTFTGAVGEVTVDTTKDVVVLHDGATAGGFPVAARANADGTISLIKKDGTSAGEINSEGLFSDTLLSTNTNQALTAARGKALNDKLFGNSQTWQDVTPSRNTGITYTNTTLRPIQVSVVMRDSGSVDLLKFFVNEVIAVSMSDIAGGTSAYQQITVTVPPTQTYRLETNNVVYFWSELR